MTSKVLELPGAIRRDFFTFIHWTFGVLNPTSSFIVHPYMEHLAFEALKFVQQNGIPLLLVNMPPRYLKSHIFSVSLAAWLLGHDPALKIMLVSYNQELSCLWARSIRDLMRSPTYRKAFPGCIINAGKDTEGYFETSQRGSLYATTVSGAMTGRGADFIIVDDPAKAEDARSSHMRDKLTSTFFDTIMTRHNDKQYSHTIVVHHRLHLDDLTGEIMSRGIDHQHICLPIITDIDRVLGLPNGETYAWKAGDPLHAERESLHEISKLPHIMGNSVYHSQYLQDPKASEGTLFEPSHFILYDVLPAGSQADYYLSLDVAANGPDATALQVWAVISGNAYLEEVHWLRGSFMENVEIIRDHLQRRNYMEFLIENSSLSVAYIEMLQEDFRKACKNHGGDIISVNARDSKEARAQACLAPFYKGQVFVKRGTAWYDDYMSEMLGFPQARYDDQVDATTQFIQHFKSLPEPLDMTGFVRVLDNLGRNYKTTRWHDSPCS